MRYCATREARSHDPSELVRQPVAIEFRREDGNLPAEVGLTPVGIRWQDAGSTDSHGILSMICPQHAEGGQPSRSGCPTRKGALYRTKETMSGGVFRSRRDLV